MKRKITLLLICISIFLYLGNNVNAENNVLGFHSVQNGRLKYSGTSKYDNILKKAVKTWNNYGNISVEFYYGSGRGNVKYSDGYNANNAFWVGVYLPETFVLTNNLPNGYDFGYIVFNKYFLDGHSSNGVYNSYEKQNLITHEFGHALGISHNNKNGNIMKPGKSSQTSLGTQDKSDYNYLWGN